MAIDTLTLSIKLAWWCKPYCYAMVIWYYMTDREPNQEQIAKWVMRGVKIEVA